MGINTYGVVLTENKDFFKIFHSVVEMLNSIIIPVRNTEMKSKGLHAAFQLKDRFSLPESSLPSHSQMVVISFTHCGEQRNLTIHFDCDDDFVEGWNPSLVGSKIIFSLNCWGNSEFFMKKVLQAVSFAGDAYYIFNDCADNAEFVKFDPAEQIEYNPELK
jgi:hypothetical protein